MNFTSYRKVILTGLILAMGAVCWTFTATAAILQVPTTSYPNIQSAINAANHSDTVEVAAGTYTGSGNTDIDFLGKAITVQCTAEDTATCTIDCESLWRRGFYFHSGEGADSVLDGFTIINGKDNEGGAISCVSSSPTIRNCSFSNNESVIAEGGAIYCSNASPVISNCEFSSNASPYDGGAIYCVNSSPTITNCAFNENAASFFGGAIFCETSSNPTIADCSFTGNSANYGAGIACKFSSPTISNCTFETNTASYYGGGLYCTASSPNVDDCTLTGNTGTRSGGGIYCEASSAPTISNCEISNNSSPGTTVNGQGGGIYSTESSPTVSGCNLIGNTAQSGAGVYSDDSSITIEYCNISSNIAGLANGDKGGGLYLDFNQPTIRHNTISGNLAYDGGGIYCYSTLAAVYDNTIKDNTAARYGGGILGDYSLAGISSCIIEGNEAQNGGGMRISGQLTSGTISVTNTIIMSNTADYGAGVEIISSSPVLINNTVFGNTATMEGGGLRYYTSYSTIRPEIINTIFWDDSPDEMRIVDGAILVQYCNIQGGYDGAGGTGNIDSDPLFTDATNKDFHLTSGSPCIDAATSLYAPPEDYDGTARWDDPDTPNTGAGDDPYYDIGAFEYYPGCAGDSEPDGDVDGSDLATYSEGNTGISLEVFASEFGKTDCF